MEMDAAVSLVRDAIPVEVPSDRRFVVAIAGPPGVGKSSLAAALEDALAGRAAVLGLDAYHFDDLILIERGYRDRKGAPHTFDVAAYTRMLTVLRNEPDLEISVPRFERALELSRNCAVVVGPQHRFVITEGNYLLLDESPWRELAELFDLTVLLAADETTVEVRSLARWQSYGLNDAEGRRRAALNDLPNARVVIELSRVADITLR